MAGRKKNFFKLFLCIGRYLGNPSLSHVGHGGIPQALSPGDGEPSCRVAACSGVGQRLLLGRDPARPPVPASSSWDTTKGVCFQPYLTAHALSFKLNNSNPSSHSPPLAPRLELGDKVWALSKCPPQRPASSRVSLGVLHSFSLHLAVPPWVHCQDKNGMFRMSPYHKSPSLRHRSFCYSTALR